MKTRTLTLCATCAIIGFVAGAFGAAPAAPTKLDAKSQTPTTATLAWTDNSANETGFRVERRVKGTVPWARVITLAPDARAFIDTGLTPGVPYEYRVQAYLEESSGWSNVDGAYPALPATTQSTTQPSTVPTTEPTTNPAPQLPAGPVVSVGPSRAVRTIDAAYAKVASSGGTIDLDPGEHRMTQLVASATKPILIRSADPMRRATIVGTSTHRYATIIEHRGDGLTLLNVILAAPPNDGSCVRAKGRRLTLDNAAARAGSFRWVEGTGDQTTLRNCDVPKLTSYAVCNFDSDSHGLVIDHCTIAGAGSNSHTVRLQRIYGLRASDSTFIAAGARSALLIRDGEDNRVERCTIVGPLGVGPLADGDGGINVPTDTAANRAKRQYLLTRTAKDDRFVDCSITTDGITVEMGVQDLLFERCRIKTTRLWALRLNDDEYRQWRNVPTGWMKDCVITGPTGLKVFENVRPGFKVEANTTVNGAEVR